MIEDLLYSLYVILCIVITYYMVRNKAVVAIKNLANSNGSSSGLINSVLCKEKVGDLSITVTRDVADASTMIDGKNDGSRVLGLLQEELAIRNLIKGVTAYKSATVHDTSTLGIVVVRHFGYTSVVKVEGEVKWDGKQIPRDIEIEDQPEEIANALNVNSNTLHVYKHIVSPMLGEKKERLSLPNLPTTNIGSYPETIEISIVHREYKGNWSYPQGLNMVLIFERSILLKQCWCCIAADPNKENIINEKEQCVDVQKMANETCLDFGDQIISLENKYRCSRNRCVSGDLKIVVKIRLQQQKGLTRELLKYKGPIHCSRMIVRDGLFGLWAGAAPTVCTMIQTKL
ncbi:tetratricopeptide repeat (TPR)-like superfamily protein [Artemisia annua]|uniref:Tetratricopeptide repeat (TPR)-like superfamily protein n=1 Tax=Artemisia annua TaxID=35608 RepID=A0A2U1KFT2_ARTAN|nr:tetratricopeptide repeat (TPR)-like superfamily protein [Artemisia annua]